MQTTQFVTYAIAGLVGIGLLQGASATTKPAVTQPKAGQLIKVFSYPYNLQVKGTAITPLEIHLYSGGGALLESTTTGTGNFTSSITIEGPGPHSLAWSGKDSSGNMISATISFSVQTIEIRSLADAIGVNINACTNFDPVLGKAEAAAAVAPDLNFVKTWVDRLDRDGIKYIRLCVAWESMFSGGSTPDPVKQANVVQQIGHWADYCAQKQIYMYPCFFTFPHFGLPSTFAAGTGNMYARGFPRYLAQPFTPSTAASDQAFFDKIYTDSAVWDAIFNTFWKPIMDRIDSNPYVLGYELCNEPPAYNATQVTGLGNFHTHIAEKIRAESSKWIMFVQVFPQGGGGWFNNTMNVDAAPRVTDIVYCPHNYAGTAVAGWAQRFTDRANAAKNVQNLLSCPVIIDEFGIGLVGADISIMTQANMDHIFLEMKRLDFGGMCWVYWPGSDPLHRMINATGALQPYGQMYINSRGKVYGY